LDTGLANKVALVCASTAGLGLASAKGLAAEGAHVVISGRRGDLATEIAKSLPKAIGVEVDLAIAGSAEKLIDTTKSALGTPDILVLNSGGPKPGSAASVTRAQYLEALEYMMLQHMELVRGVLPSMIEKGWGRIVAIGSTAIQTPNPDLALSGIIRASLASYLKMLSREVAANGITVNMALPGRVDTDRVQFLDSQMSKKLDLPLTDVQNKSLSTIPAGRYGKTEEFAALITFLCSTGASFITGEQIRCDGGRVSSY
jgi:3-oxoacyl-[acyl-carrier protein] reductase